METLSPIEIVIQALRACCRKHDNWILHSVSQANTNTPLFHISVGEHTFVLGSTFSGLMIYDGSYELDEDDKTIPILVAKFELVVKETIFALDYLKKTKAEDYYRSMYISTEKD